MEKAANENCHATLQCRRCATRLAFLVDASVALDGADDDPVELNCQSRRWRAPGVAVHVAMPRPSIGLSRYPFVIVLSRYRTVIALSR